MRKSFMCAAFMLLAFMGIKAQENAGIPDLKSPDGRLVVSFSLTGTENPTYSVKYSSPPPAKKGESYLGSARM